MFLRMLLYGRGVTPKLLAQKTLGPWTFFEK